jgi:prevent-host-death family protein
VTTVNVHEAKTNLSRLLGRVERGERIIIARAGKPVAVLIPYAPSAVRRIPGRDEGQIRIGEDFDQPLPDMQV